VRGDGVSGAVGVGIVSSDGADTCPHFVIFLVYTSLCLLLGAPIRAKGRMEHPLAESWVRKVSFVNSNISPRHCSCQTHGDGQQQLSE